MMVKSSAILAILGLYVIAAPSLVRCQETRGLPVWKPAEVRTKRLAAESKFGVLPAGV